VRSLRIILAALGALLAPAIAHAQDQATVVSSCGSITIKAGTQHFRTIDLTGQTCNSGGAATGACSEATSYLARTAGGNEGGNAAPITALICGLVADGLWSKFDALYLPAQQNEADARLNLVSTSFTLPASSATFVPYQGYSHFTAGTNTGFIPGTTAGRKFQDNNGSLGVWAYDTPDFGLQMGASTNTGGSAIAAAYSGGAQYYCYIAYATPPYATPPGLPGFYSCDKADATNVGVYFNGALLVTQAQGTSASPGESMYVGSAAYLAATQKTVSEVNFGSSLGGTPGQLALNNRLHTYMMAVGWTGAVLKPGPKPPDQVTPHVEPKP
jgi:hypothetical protein